VAAAMVSTGFQWLIGLSILSQLGGIICLLGVLSVAGSTLHTYKETQQEWRLSKELLQGGGLLLVQALIIGVVAGGIKGALEDYYSVFLESKGIVLSLIGVVIAGFEIIKVIGSRLARHVGDAVQKQIVLLGMIGVVFIASVLVEGVYVVFLLALLTLLDVLLWIANDASIQHLARDENRATLASLKNFGIEGIALVVFGLFSVIVSFVSLQGLYVVAGIILVVLSILLWMKGVLWSEAKGVQS